MNQTLRHRLNRLNSDCKEVWGNPVRHFFCPVLYLDKNVDLCKAHIINQAFGNSDRSWTIQRKDIDSFYGSYFEAEFVLLQEKGRYKADEVLEDKKLRKRLKPQLTIDEEIVEYYFPKGNIPDSHTLIKLLSQDKIIELAVKKSADEIRNSKPEGLGIQIDKNIQLSALVSLIKAAHLTLYHLCGYQHVFSAGGFFLGRRLLGDFFLMSQHQTRMEILGSAAEYFAPFCNMVRPMLTNPLCLKGTLTDHWLYVCVDRSRIWALLLFIRTQKHMHAVVTPLLENKKDIIRFAGFLQEPSPTLRVKRTKWKGDSWEVDPEIIQLDWPEAQFFA